MRSSVAPRRARPIETVLHDRAFNGVTHADILTILNRYGSLDASKEAAHTPNPRATRSAFSPTRSSSGRCFGPRSSWWREKNST